MTEAENPFKRQVDAKADAISQRAQDVSARRAAGAEYVRKLETENKSLKEQLASRPDPAYVAELEQEKASLAARARELEREKSQLDDLVGKLSDRPAIDTSSLDSLRRELERQQERAANAESRAKSLGETTREYEERIAGQEEEISRQGKFIESLKGDNRTLQEKINAYELEKKQRILGAGVAKGETPEALAQRLAEAEAKARELKREKNELEGRLEEALQTAHLYEQVAAERDELKAQLAQGRPPANVSDLVALEVPALYEEHNDMLRKLFAQVMHLYDEHERGTIVDQNEKKWLDALRRCWDSKDELRRGIDTVHRYVITPEVLDALKQAGVKWGPQNAEGHIPGLAKAVQRITTRANDHWELEASARKVAEQRDALAEELVALRNPSDTTKPLPSARTERYQKALSSVERDAYTIENAVRTGETIDRADLRAPFMQQLYTVITDALHTRTKDARPQTTPDNPTPLALRQFNLERYFNALADILEDGTVDNELPKEAQDAAQRLERQYQARHALERIVAELEARLSEQETSLADSDARVERANDRAKEHSKRANAYSAILAALTSAQDLEAPQLAEEHLAAIPEKDRATLASYVESVQRLKIQPMTDDEREQYEQLLRTAREEATHYLEQATELQEKIEPARRAIALAQTLGQRVQTLEQQLAQTRADAGSEDNIKALERDLARAQGEAQEASENLARATTIISYWGIELRNRGDNLYQAVLRMTGMTDAQFFEAYFDSETASQQAPAREAHTHFDAGLSAAMKRNFPTARTELELALITNTCEPHLTIDTLSQLASVSTVIEEPARAAVYADLISTLLASTPGLNPIVRQHGHALAGRAYRSAGNNERADYHIRISKEIAESADRDTRNINDA
ncbi:hypothetical protein C4580_05895 [Candidatus Woesearchaeota archaeon]|nr:MAG: hypothetical protein C4580_05895 [Candidatus Woesearchaeota archaeon]